MATTFLHGTETVTTVVGARQIQEVKSGIIFAIGAAPSNLVAGAPAANTLLRLVNDSDDAAKVGPKLPGYDLPLTLEDLRAEGGATVIAVNVFDPSIHKTTIAVATYPIADKTLQLPKGNVTALTVTTIADAPTVEGTDWTLDRATGTLTVKGALNAAVSAKVAFTHGDPTKVTATDIVGAVSAGGVRTGIQLALASMSAFGVAPKILIAPGWSADAAVQQALDAVAIKLRAVCLADVAAGSALEDVLEGRLPEGELTLLSTSKRTIYCYPYARVSIPGGTEVRPYSASVAGVIARTDRELGYHHSPSNKKLRHVVGLETPLTASINDPDCDTNRLNEVGVLTIFAAGTSGIRTWGNRSAAFPSANDILTFIACQRTSDMISEAIEYYTLEHLDGPITDVLIKAVLADVGEFINTLMARGALIAGSKVECRPERNPTAALANGKITFTRTECPPPPAEHIIHEQVIDTTLLANIFGG